nr:MAG TPA: hypothetical protein [Caudoviricetes sp.]
MSNSHNKVRLIFDNLKMSLFIFSAERIYWVLNG